MQRWLALFILAATGYASVSAQSNDSFATRLSLTGPSPTAVSNNLYATRETGEPIHAASGVGRTLWWTWTAPATSTVNLSASYGGKGVLPMRALAVYTGNTLSSLTEVASTNNLTQSNYLNSYYPAAQFAAGNSVNVPVTAGTVYQIAVDALAALGYFDDDGTVALAINAPPIIVSAASITGTTGAAFTYSVLATNGSTVYAAASLAPGLAINPTSGQITGTLTAAGTYNVGLSATGPGGTGNATLTLLVSDPVAAAPVVPVFTSAAAVNGPVGTAVSFYLSATGTPTAYTAGPLPDGLTFNASTGLISGTPTTAGITTVPVTTTGAAGTGTATLTFNVIATVPAPVITSALAITGTTGYSLSTSVVTAGDGSAACAPTGYSAANLPPGLSFSATSGQFSGTPTQAGVYPVPITVTNRGGTRSAILTLTIAAPATAGPVTPAQPILSSSATAAGIVGTAFSYQMAAANTPTSFGVGTLPAGLTLDPQKGTISGTPTAAGTFAVPVSAANALGTSTGTLKITIAANATAQNVANGYALPVISSAASAEATVGKTFSYSVQALYQGLTTVTGAGNWTFTATGLPPGLGITATSSSGSTGISGTPTTAGTYPVTISATCPASGSVYSPHPAATGTAVVTMVVSPAAVINDIPSIASNAGVALTVGSAASYFISTSSYSGASISNYSATGLPPGMSIPTSPPTSGYITGTPTTPGTYAATVSATNAYGTGTATVTFTVVAQPLPVITSQTAASGTVGSSFSYTITASASPTSTSAGTLPPGLSFVAASNAITGTPTTPGVYTVPLTATNATGTANATLTITINPVASSPPVISSYAMAQGYVSQYFSYSISVQTGTVSSYGASNLPPGLSLTSYGYIYGTPTANGTYAVPISATNAAGITTAMLVITVSNSGVPVLSGYAALDAMVGQAFSYSLYASNSPTSYTFSGLPAGVTASASSPGYISGTPTKAGVYPVAVSAMNGVGTATGMLTITVAPTPLPAVPFFQGTINATGVVGVPFYYYSYPANNPSSLTLDSIPAGLAFNTSTGVLSGTPTVASDDVLNFAATNAGGTGRGIVNLHVAAKPANVPIVTSPSGAVAYAGEAFYYALTADYSPTGYTVSGLPPGLTFNSSTGVISGVTTGSTASYPVTVSATNAAGTSQGIITILVQFSPTPPHFTSPAMLSAIVGQSFTTTLACNTAANAFTVGNLPAGLTYNSSTGVISGTPTSTALIILPVTATTAAGTASAKVSLLIRTAPPIAPVITSAAGIGGYVGVPLSYAVAATNSPVSYSAPNGLPAGLNFNQSTGVISGTPTATDSGSYYIYAANNTSGSIVYVTFNITSTVPYFSVQVTNPAMASVYTGQAFNLALQISPASTDWTTTVSGLPPGVYFNAATNTISGTPTTPGTYPATITVGNYSFTNKDTIVLVVTSSTALPVLTSAASAVSTVGNTFSYYLYASNSPTAFTVSNLPDGLSYNASTHAITGTSTTAGIYLIPLTATNAVGQTGATLTLVISPAVTTPPDLMSSGNPIELTYTVGAAPAWSIYASSNPQSYAASNLPPGVTLNTSTGAISGTLTTVGTYPVTITASNSIGSASAVVTVVITPATVAPPSLYLPAESVAYTGLATSYSLTQSYDNVTVVSADGLPPGLTLNTTTSVVSGTPSAVGLYRVNVSLTNAGGTTTAVWTLLVKDGSSLVPQFSTGAAEVVATLNQSFGFQAYASIYDSGVSVSAPCTFTITGAPPGMAATSYSSYLYLYGAPTVAGTYPMTITATGPGGGSATEMVTLLVLNPSAPTITTPATLSGNVNAAFSFSVTTNTGAVISSYGAGTLPDGLVFNTKTGAITGSPTTAGTFTVPVSATGVGGTASAVLTLRIGAALYGGMPLINSAAATSSQEFPVDSTSYNYYPYQYYQPSTVVSYALSAFNRPTSFTAQNLPAGLGFNPSTGVISGQPTTPGVYQVPVSATNAVGTFSTTLTVIVSSPMPSARAALAYASYLGGTCYTTVSYSFPSFPYYPYGYFLQSNYYLSPIYPTYAASGLPPGLSINTYNGVISGTALQSGIYPVTVSTIGRGGTGTATMTFFIADTAPATGPATVVAPAFNSKAEALGFIGLPMNYFLTAARATSYSATGLPGGLTLNTVNGAITGTPTTAGTFPVNVSASNAGGTAQATLSLTVESAPTAPAVSSAAGTSASIGVPFSFMLNSSNFPGMPTATVYAVDTLPTGLSWNAATGSISGVATGPVGTYPVAVTAFVGTAATANVILTISILPTPATLPPPVLTSPAGALGLLGNPFLYTIQSSAFAPPSTLPAGLTYDAAKGTISGYPTSAGVYLIPLSAPGASVANSVAVTTGRKKPGHGTTGKPAIPKGPSLLSRATLANGVSPAASSTLTLRVTAPDLSLPRLLTPPSGGSVIEGQSFAFTAAATGAPPPNFQWVRNGAPVPATGDSTLVLDPVQLSDAGTYSLTVFNAAGSVTGTPVSLVVGTTYGNWQAQHFTAQEIAQGLAADECDFAGDGASNLLKYGLGLDPRSNASNLLPLGTWSPTGQNLQIQYTRDAAKADINYIVEVSADLNAWTVVAQSIAGTPTRNIDGGSSVAETTLPGSSRCNVTVAASRQAGGGPQFLRLRIVRP